MNTSGTSAPSSRRWHEGQTGTVDGIAWRVVSGRKNDSDLVLQFFMGTRWVSVSMLMGAMMADFLYENEENLYPQAKGYQGGLMYLNLLNKAATEGWEHVSNGGFKLNA